MASSFRKSVVNKQQKSAYINGGGFNADSKFKGRTGVVIPNRVFVGGICPTATETDLFNLFGKYGIVKACKIVSDQNGSSKGYGFVTFEKADDVIRLQNDAKNLVFNERRLNVAPAVMKNPPYVGRFAESYVVPVTPNLYFTNNLPYQYQEGTTVYPNSPYGPPLTVVPTVADTAYYHQNNYGIPATPFQGAALFYPVPPNASPVMVGPQGYSSYQPVGSNSSNYVYSSPAPATSSPPISTAKSSTAMTTATNSSEMHASHSSPVITAVPPNVSSLPPPLPYHLAHPPQYYNGSIMPPYSGEVYYNMVHSACYPMMTVNGQETYIPYYDVGESCSNNVATEEINCETTKGYQSNAGSMQIYPSEASGCDSSSASVASNECKPMPPMGPPPVNDHAREQHVYSPENVAPPTAASATPQTPTIQSQHAAAAAEYNSSAYVQHRSATIIYPSTPMPQQNVYFNSMYMAEAANASLGQCPYSKNLSEQFVSDHLPKRDSKYPPKKFNPAQAKDTPPNIPKFPFFINNNHPGFVNRNMKEKDFRNMNGKSVEVKTPQRQVRHLSYGNNPPKPRVFHNQNQYGGPPRPMKTDRNGHMMPPNMQYPRTGPGGLSRQVSYEQATSPHAYEYQNNYQAYPKNNGYDGYRKQGQTNNNHNNNNNYAVNNNNNGGYRGKYDKVNGPSGDSAYTKTNEERATRKYNTQSEETSGPTSDEHTQLEQQNTPTVPVTMEQQQQQVCVEMQSLTL